MRKLNVFIVIDSLMVYHTVKFEECLIDTSRTGSHRFQLSDGALKSKGLEGIH